MCVEPIPPCSVFAVFIFSLDKYKHGQTDEKQEPDGQAAYTLAFLLPFHLYSGLWFSLPAQQVEWPGQPYTGNLHCLLGQMESV